MREPNSAFPITEDFACGGEPLNHFALREVKRTRERTKEVFERRNGQLHLRIVEVYWLINLGKLKPLYRGPEIRIPDVRSLNRRHCTPRHLFRFEAVAEPNTDYK